MILENQTDVHEAIEGLKAALYAKGVDWRVVAGYYTPPEGPALRTWLALPDGTHGCIHGGGHIMACTACREADERIGACKVWGPHAHFEDKGRWWVLDRHGRVGPEDSAE